MRIKDGYMIREIADCYVVIPVGERLVELTGIMSLNESGYFIWNCMTDDIQYDRLMNMVLHEYDIDERTARADLDEFLNKVRENGLLEE